MNGAKGLNCSLWLWFRAIPELWWLTSSRELMQWVVFHCFISRHYGLWLISNSLWHLDPFPYECFEVADST